MLVLWGMNDARPGRLARALLRYRGNASLAISVRLHHLHHAVMLAVPSATSGKACFRIRGQQRRDQQEAEQNDKRKCDCAPHCRPVLKYRCAQFAEGQSLVCVIWSRISTGKTGWPHQLDIMSRNFYILAGTLAFFALVSAGMALVPSSFQPGLPANGSLWRTVALVLLLAGLGAALIGVMSDLFEQVDRRSEEARQTARRKRRGEKH